MLLIKHSLHMQTTPYDGLWKVRKRSDNFGKFIHQFQAETKYISGNLKGF